MINQHEMDALYAIEHPKERIDKLIEYLFEIRKYDPDASIRIAQDVRAQAKAIGYAYGEGRALNHEAFCYSLKAEYEQALKILHEAMDYAKKLRDEGLRARVCKNYGNVYRDLGNLSEALSYYERSIFIYEKLGREKELASVLLLIANLHLDLFEYDNALDYAKRCLSIAQKHPGFEQMPELHLSLGNIYFKKEKFDESGHEFQAAIEQSGEDSIIHNLAKIGFGKVRYKKKNYNEALNFLNSSLHKGESLKHIESLITAHFYLGRVYLDLGNLHDAKNHFLASYEIALEHSRQHDVMSIHEYLSKLYEQLGEIQKAYENLKSYEKLKEKIFQENTINKLRHLQSKQEIELATKEKEVAEQTAKLKQQFIANMSHEIRTPMNAIVGMTRQIMEKEPRPDQLIYLNAISQSADNLLVIINDILDFSKIEAGKVRVEKIPFSLKDCLKNVVNILRIKAEEKNLKLWFTMHEQVPKNIIGDPTRLTQILINLVGNAVKFTESGSVDIILELVKIENEKHFVSFKVKDTGIGISEDYVNKIFESFSQAGTDLARKYGGTGLGLTISKQLVELMNGSIGVKSTLGKGTTFEFILPFKLASAGWKKETIEIKTLSEDEKNILNRSIILLAEDNEFNKILAEDVLKEAAPNMQIIYAENGIDVLEILHEQKVDLILMDVQMPVMNGVEATKIIREENNSVPIIAMTANVMQDDIQNYLSIGMLDHIPKPFEKYDLYFKLLKYLPKEEIKMRELKSTTTLSQKNENQNEAIQNEKELVDMSFLKDFTKNDATKMKKYLGLYLENAPQLHQRLAQGINNTDYSEIKIASHSLKTQMRYMGIKDEKSFAYAIEQMATNKEDIKKIADKNILLSQALATSLLEVEEILNSI